MECGGGYISNKVSISLAHGPELRQHGYFVIKVFKILLMFNIFTNYTNSECIVHCFIEEVTVKLDYIGMILGFKELHRLFLVLI